MRKTSNRQIQYNVENFDKIHASSASVRNWSSQCAICKEGHFSTSITSHHNSKTHNIKQSVTCKSNNVCYLIDYSKCEQQYVGETELEFHCRMNNHKSDIRLENKSNGMVRHFSKCGIDNVMSNILEKLRSRDHYIRKSREQYYIELLEPQINAQ